MEVMVTGMQRMEATYYTAAQLAARGNNDIPRELVSTTHLIYSSPATLAFNSPGAEGYGVKRAGLSVPDSVMLIVSPGCCGRNTSAISRMPGYEDRFFYLTMDQTDLVTGRHLKKIPRAVEEICRGMEALGRRPRVVMICITCVDALLGTDMERICRRAEEKVPDVRVQPCYMYALTREGRKPPMVHVRQSIYELLEPRRKKSTSVNILGFFAPVEEGDRGSEFFPLLRQAGIRKIRQIGSCEDYGEFQAMAEANFNIVLNPEARPAAYDLQERLGIPFIELGRFYQIDRIRAQYAALGRVLSTSFDDAQWEKEAVQAVEDFRQKYPQAVFSVGEAMNASPFELACALVREGFAVREIFGTVGKDTYVWINLLAQLSPQTRIYSNLHPSMLHYDSEQAEGKTASGPSSEPGSSSEPGAVTVSIGRDAGWYHPDLPNVQWNSDVQPFGYRAVTGLFRALMAAMETGSRGSHASMIMLKGRDEQVSADGEAGEDTENIPAETAGSAESADSAGLSGTAGSADSAGLSGAAGSAESAGFSETAGVSESAGSDLGILKSSRPDIASADKVPRGFRRVSTPFAPDQSGAVSVLYDMGGICVICDAGGCTGNICGFDEPRWFGAQSAVFSAGLRDMDAILGRDDRLVEKLADAANRIPAAFASIVGTPVPAVIGTDYRALCRMAARKTGLPVLGVDTDGMEYYDKGIEKTYLALLETFCKPGKRAANGKADDNIPALQSRDRKAALENIPDAAPDAASNLPQDRNTDQKKAGLTDDSADNKKIAGIWGFSPLDFAGIISAESLRRSVASMGFGDIICCGAGTDTESLKQIGKAEKNFVLSPAGAAAAKWLEERYGTPWEYWIPDAERIRTRFDGGFFSSAAQTLSGKKVLIIHQQVLADALRHSLEENGVQADTAGFFLMNRDLMRPGDVALREESDIRKLVTDRKYDYVICDRALEPILSGLSVTLIHLPHFAVSGELSQD